jgi:uncharacterized membrane protein
MIKYESTVPVISTRSMCQTAVMTALICLMTVVPRIPIPLGYAHLGDAVIFLVILYAGYKEGAIAASLGSAFADLIGGFPLWVIPTIIIKYGMAVIIWRVLRRHRDVKRVLSLYPLAGLILSAIWMVIGYILGGAILYGGLVIGLTAAPGLIFEGIFNVLVAVGAGLVMEKAGFSVGQYIRREK